MVTAGCSLQGLGGRDGFFEFEGEAEVDASIVVAEGCRRFIGSGVLAGLALPRRPRFEDDIDKIDDIILLKEDAAVEAVASRGAERLVGVASGSLRRRSPDSGSSLPSLPSCPSSTIVRLDLGGDGSRCRFRPQEGFGAAILSILSG